ncbi:hypothetical protein LWI28_025504 [Acer negundo]|uniref:Uncharacterized protein n=1 Tax=Acer negundo TaxID=4023 RepID=A0AAD5IN73_ACENE|nr:hypothetical protein LWI28_025504 [Acer negundo]
MPMHTPVSLKHQKQELPRGVETFDKDQIGVKTVEKDQTGVSVFEETSLDKVEGCSVGFEKFETDTAGLEKVEMGNVVGEGGLENVVSEACVSIQQTIDVDDFLSPPFVNMVLPNPG